MNQSLNPSNNIILKIYNFKILTFLLILLFCPLNKVEGISSMEEYILLNKAIKCSDTCKHLLEVNEEFVSANFNEIVNFHISRLELAVSKNDEQSFKHHIWILYYKYLYQKASLNTLDIVSNKVIQISKNSSSYIQALTPISFLYGSFGIYTKSTFYAKTALNLISNEDLYIPDREHYNIYFIYYISFIENVVLEIKNEEKNNQRVHDLINLLNRVNSSEKNLSGRSYDNIILALDLLLFDKYGTDEFHEIIENFDRTLAGERAKAVYDLMYIKDKMAKGEEEALSDAIEMLVASNQNFLGKPQFKFNIFTLIFDYGLERIGLKERDIILSELEKYKERFSFIESSLLFPKVIGFFNKKNDKSSALEYSNLLNSIYTKEFKRRNNIGVEFIDIQTKKIHAQEKLINKFRLKFSVTFVVSIFLLLFAVLLVLFIRYRSVNQTKLNKLNSDLINKNSIISNHNQVLKSFAYTLAHDIQEPIRNLKYALNYDVISTMPTRVIGEIKEMNDASLVYLNNLTNDFLTYCLTSQEKSKLDKVNVLDCLELAKYSVQHLAEKIVLHYDVKDFYIECSQTDVVSIFQNLFKNAIKYCSWTKVPEIDVDVHYINGELFIAVSDNGIGVPIEKREEILLPFKRLSGLRKTKGSGLGLSIVSNIIKKYNGSIQILSNEKEGTLIEISLKVKQVSTQKNLIQ